MLLDNKYYQLVHQLNLNNNLHAVILLFPSLNLKNYSRKTIQRNLCQKIVSSFNQIYRKLKQYMNGTIKNMKSSKEYTFKLLTNKASRSLVAFCIFFCFSFIKKKTRKKEKERKK